MWRIQYFDTDAQTRMDIIEYGFSPYITRRLSFLVNEGNYKIVWIFPLSRTVSNFVKCFKKIVKTT